MTNTTNGPDTDTRQIRFLLELLAEADDWVNLAVDAADECDGLRLTVDCAQEAVRSALLDVRDALADRTEDDASEAPRSGPWMHCNDCGIEFAGNALSCPYCSSDDVEPAEATNEDGEVAR